MVDKKNKIEMCGLNVTFEQQGLYQQWCYNDMLIYCHTQVIKKKEEKKLKSN